MTQEKTKDTNGKMKIKIRFAKSGEMRYISHLDLLRLFQRASRRAGLPVAISKGFSPRPRINIMPAIKLGVESDNLETRFLLERRMDAGELINRLQSQLPKGIKILEGNEYE